MKTESSESAREQVALKKEQAYIRKLLGVEEEKIDLTSEEIVKDSDLSSCEALDEDSEKIKPEYLDRTTSVMSSDRGYVLSSEENKSQDKMHKCVSFVVDLNVDNNCVVNEIIETYNLKNLPLDLQKLLEGMNQGIPSEYAVPIDKRPDWLDMKKFTIGQTFAQNYYFGLNYSEMLALLILFSFPDALQPLIFTENSGTPFTAFRRYLSTVLRVKSWFEHDVWSEGNLGYRNMKAVRAMHLNISKRLNTSSYSELESQLTLWGSPNGEAVWCPLKQQIQEDFQSCCPFQAYRPIDDKRCGKVFVNQLDMSITQFGFVGLIIMYPDKFGAGSATYEELDGFVHLWRGLGYLLGIEDKYNFCSGSLEEVRQRSHHLIENWAKPSLQHVTEDWEHMSRCLVEGVSYYVPGVSFEVALSYLCWVLDINAPRLNSALSWWQTCMFNLMKFTMCFTLRVPGMLPFHNWLIRKAISKAASMSPDRLKKLESKTYDYENQAKFNTKL